ncbi:DNA cytosine methyltransferase [Faecalibacillus intestinalis]|uniref:DNA cytosine methyltransferase n=1 Tax=Faecalibacillus intestinalis TaxID=1982626 RepID=UPI0035222230
MNVVSFFSGAGGLDLGFELAGHNIIWANDFDEQAINSYNKNIGSITGINAGLGDITKILDTSKENIDSILPDADVIIGGFPCQGFTIANLQRSMKDEKNHLYLQLLKAIAVKQPKYFFLENVKGLENMEKGKILPMILDDLENAGTPNSKIFPDNGYGYTVSYNVFNALNFGVPENRERVIILGIRNDILDKTQIKKYIDFNITQKKYDYRKRLVIPITHSKSSNLIQKQKPYEIINELYHQFKTGNIKPKKIDQNSKIYKSTTLFDAISDLPLEYDESIPNHIGSKCKVKIANRIGNRATFWNKEAPTIMGRGSGTGGPLIPPHPNQHRRFSVREVARIQTFPDDFYFCGSNSCGYRQIGNAVPVLMAYNLSKIFNE